ncbi:unnamed protein product [Polarella glacialis]|uniref:Uncharacterized protein n=1 Tax=Polarella glacialis TaxID=89957 RepID=A0A813IMM5_POLGL|nr:unnamed protein product [Polarella glacialis]
MKMPAWVLTDDDPCLDDHAQCGTALIQRGNSHRPAQRELLKKEAVLTTASATSRKVKAPQQISKNLSLSSSSPSAISAKERTAASLLLADMRQLITKVKLRLLTSSQVRHLADEYAKLLETGAMPKINLGYQEQQKLLQAHAAGFDRCDADLQGRIETGTQLEAMRNGWSQLHQDCRTHERRLQIELTRCNEHLNALRDQKEAECKAINATEATPAAAGGELLVQQKRQCQDASQGYIDQWSICEEGQRFFDTKRSECDSSQQSMHTSNCARVSQVSGICDTYDLCRAGMILAYTSAKEATRAWERYHKAESLAVVTIRCFADSLGKSENNSVVLMQMEHCEQQVANASLFNLEYKDVPPPMACDAVEASPCVVKLSSGRVSPPAERSKAVASAVFADESAEAEAVAGISFVQEGIERATGAFPEDMHKAFFGPMATPVALTLMLLTVLMLMIRCSALVREKREQHAARAAEQSGSLPVDAWCISSHSSPANLDGLVPRDQMAQDGRWLCPELVVPRNSKCIINAPRLGAEGLATQNALVTDKMGQLLFTASHSCVEPGELKTDNDIDEKLSLTRQDGTVLVTCHLVLPKGAGGRKRARCYVLQRDGGLFATLGWDDGRITWLSRITRRASDKPSAFVLAPASGAWQLRVLESNNSVGGHFSVVDQLSRPVAGAELGRPESSDFGGCNRNFFRVEVNSLCNTDLGLVTAVILAADRLREVCRAD